MDEMLKKISKNGHVDALYSLLVEDPEVLERIDRLPIVETPLHIAAAAGNTRFVKEMVTLKPSLARKLNPLGLSSMHLALQQGKDQTVKAMIAIDSELVRVKARGRITPLHYAAEIENLDLLAEFLSVCPSSIEELTVKRETAVHIAVKNKKLQAFKVLKGWLLRNNREILKWTDEDGNTALHIATSTNQFQVVKLLIGNVNVNTKNFEDLTAMDIFHLQQDSLDRKIGNILHRARAKRASEIIITPSTLAEKLSRRLSLVEMRDVYLGIIGQSLQKSPNDVRNVILVVATLIATATYQASLSAPGGYWQEDIPPTNSTTTSNYNVSQVQKRHQAGEMIFKTLDLIIFLFSNGLAFCSSVLTILIVIVGLPFSHILYLSTSCLLYAYFTAMALTFPSPTYTDNDLGTTNYLLIAFATVGFTYCIPVMALFQWLSHLGKKLKMTRLMH